MPCNKASALIEKLARIYGPLGMPIREREKRSRYKRMIAKKLALRD
jgi:hypothetical protein